MPAGWEQIDLLVNNAGLALGLNPAQGADLDDWDAMVDTNCKGLMYVTRAVLPTLLLVAAVSFITMPYTLGHHPGEAAASPQAAARHMT